MRLLIGPGSLLLADTDQMGATRWPGDARRLTERLQNHSSQRPAYGITSTCPARITFALLRLLAFIIACAVTP